METGGGRESVRPPAGDRPAGQLLVAPVVAVEDRGLLYAFVGGSGSQVDQPGLRLEVILPAGVVIEMVVSDIGDGGDIEVACAHALLDQCVRGSFDDGALDACL